MIKVKSLNNYSATTFTQGNFEKGDQSYYRKITIHSKKVGFSANQQLVKKVTRGTKFNINSKRFSGK